MEFSTLNVSLSRFGYMFVAVACINPLVIEFSTLNVSLMRFVCGLYKRFTVELSIVNVKLMRFG